MTTKIDITAIIREHFDSLRDASTKRVSYWDVFVMFGLPVVLGFASFAMGFQIKNEYIGTLVGAFSIFAGFLFNIIVLIYGFDPPRKDGDNAEDQMELLSQTFANISYAVVISISIVVILIASLFTSGCLDEIASALAVMLFANFGLSLMMVLKRIYVLLGLKFHK